MKECPRCHCRDETYFYSEQGRTYCRRCLPFGKVYLDDVWPVVLPRSYTQKVFYTLDYTLTLQQQMISSSILESVKNNHHVSILAVCGAGKTELVYESLCYVLNQGKRVCFALPRRELAKEIYERLSHQRKGPPGRPGDSGERRDRRPGAGRRHAAHFCRPGGNDCR